MIPLTSSSIYIELVALGFVFVGAVAGGLVCIATKRTWTITGTPAVIIGVLLVIWGTYFLIFLARYALGF